MCPLKGQGTRVYCTSTQLKNLMIENKKQLLLLCTLMYGIHMYTGGKLGITYLKNIGRYLPTCKAKNLISRLVDYFLLHMYLFLIFCFTVATYLPITYFLNT